MFQHEKKVNKGSVFGALTLAVQLTAAASEARLPDAPMPSADQAPVPAKVVQDTAGKSIVVKEQRYGPYEFIAPASPVASSPNGQHWILFARKKGGQEVFVVDGKEQPSPVKVGGSFVYKVSDDGQTWAACVLASAKSNPPECYFILNGKAFGPYATICGISGRGWSPLMTPSGATVAVYAGKAGQGLFAVVNGKEFGPYLNPKSFYASPEGSFWSACMQRDKLQDVLLVNGKEYGPYVWCSPVFLSEDGKRWGAVAGKNTPSGQQVVQIVDGQEGPTSPASIKDLPIKAVSP